MGLVATWSEVATNSNTLKSFTVTQPVPAGRLLVLAVGRGGGATAITSIGTVNGNPWTVQGVGAHTNGTVNVTLATCYVTTAISAGANFNVTYNATGNRWAAVFGVFDKVVSPIQSANMPAVLSTAQPNVDAGPTTPALAVPRALVLTAVASTGGGFPIVNRGDKIVGQVITNGGSAERMVALLCKEEGGYTHTGSYNVPNSVISVATTAAIRVNPLPAGSIPLMTVDGEVEAKLSRWNGSTEAPIASLSLA